MLVVLIMPTSRSLVKFCSLNGAMWETFPPGINSNWPFKTRSQLATMVYKQAFISDNSFPEKNRAKNQNSQAVTNAAGTPSL